MLSETDWEEAQQLVMVAWHRGDFARALSEIDRVLGEGTDEMKGQSLVYRGMIRESQGALEAAKQDWSDALSHVGEGTYARYVGERSLGEVCERLGQTDEAERWYRVALATCAAGAEFSGGLALQAFVRLKGQQLSRTDKALIAAVAEKSWRALELPGKPDLSDTDKLVATLARDAGKT